MLKKLFFFIFIAASAWAGQSTIIVADKALYDGDRIILTGHVDIENHMGNVKAEKATLYKDDEKKSDIDFPFIELETNVVATLTNKSILFCRKISIDAIALTSDLEGEDTITFHDQRGKMTALQGHVDYQRIEKEIVANKVTLLGNVKMSSKKEKGISQALADKVEIFPEDKKMIFYGNPVLFYDEENTLQLSAKRVEASQDKVTGKEKVYGYGEVRFTFADEELDKLKKAFSK